jgi:hypothetical protein
MAPQPLTAEQAAAIFAKLQQALQAEPLQQLLAAKAQLAAVKRARKTPATQLQYQSLIERLHVLADATADDPAQEAVQKEVADTIEELQDVLGELFARTP